MIIGLGSDIINNNRIRMTLEKFGDRFKKRCFTSLEIDKCENRHNKVNSYAKRYAAKEACAKALGSGLARGIFWKDIEVMNDKFGKRLIKLHNNALSKLKELTQNNYRIVVSLSDEAEDSISNVVIVKDE